MFGDVIVQVTLSAIAMQVLVSVPHWALVRITLSVVLLLILLLLPRVQATHTSANRLCQVRHSTPPSLKQLTPTPPIPSVIANTTRPPTSPLPKTLRCRRCSRDNTPSPSAERPTRPSGCPPHRHHHPPPPPTTTTGPPRTSRRLFRRRTIPSATGPSCNRSRTRRGYTVHRHARPRHRHRRRRRPHQRRRRLRYLCHPLYHPPPARRRLVQRPEQHQQQQSRQRCVSSAMHRRVIRHTHITTRRRPYRTRRRRHYCRYPPSRLPFPRTPPSSPTQPRTPPYRRRMPVFPACFARSSAPGYNLPC